MESHYRSIVKAISWRAGGTVVTFAVAWILTPKEGIRIQRKADGEIFISIHYKSEKMNLNHLLDGNPPKN